jgi:hypothetical protein
MPSWRVIKKVQSIPSPFFGFSVLKVADIAKPLKTNIILHEFGPE